MNGQACVSKLAAAALALFWHMMNSFNKIIMS